MPSVTRTPGATLLPATTIAATLPPAMLYLLHSPAWAPPGQTPRPLPITVPAALLVVLATRATWMAREQLALIFWPDAAPSDALHHLRINLHRARSLLEGWGLGEALVAERSRVQLRLPTDLAELRAAQAQGDAGLLARLSPAQWLQGWRLPGYDGFAQWCDDTAQALQAEWLAAGRGTGIGTGIGASAPTGDSTEPVGAAPSLAVPPAPAGREEEFARLLHSAAPAVLVRGEPGAGKTTLLQAAWPWAPCLRGLEGLHAMPYRPLLDVLRQRIPTLQRALRDPGHRLRPYRLDLARVLPELAPEEALPPLDALTAQTRLVEALTRAFEALSPVLLVDDLPWCDSATLEWLLMLAHGGRLRWRASARAHEIGPRVSAGLSMEPPGDLPVARTLHALRSAGLIDEIDLPPLPRQAIEQACRQRVPGVTPRTEVLDRLQALSGGNAFLLGELLAAGLGADDPGHPPASVQARIGQLVQARLDGLPDAVRRLVEAAAVFVEPVPPEALAVGTGAGGPGAAPPASLGPDTETAVAAGLLRRDGGRLACRHDLIRQTLVPLLSPSRRAALHRHAALWLATQPVPDALTIAEHWRAAGEPQTALAWRHRGADQLKSRGRFDEARALWREVADDSVDAAQALRAQLELAACDLFEDLARGEAALNAVQARLGAVADPEQHRQIEGRLRSALVDNRVFAGDIAGAGVHAARLRELLPALPVHDRVDALEVLIELAMREPDIPAAWACLGELQQLAPRRPTLLSFEGQIHWFGGEVRAAHDALARLLDRHPDYCRGITIENDLAVMLQALGRIDEAEAMARRSLDSWAGVAHTETLSLLVLGLTLTSAGRHAEADAALARALQLAHEQASPGFEAEARVRRARLWLQWGRPGDAEAAHAALETAATMLAASPEPLRVSQLGLARVQAALATRRPVPDDAVSRLQDAARRSAHPLVQARHSQVRALLAAASGDAAGADAAAEAMAGHARAAGLLEPLAEAWLLRAAHGADPVEAAAHLRMALELAQRQGLGDLQARAARMAGAASAPPPRL